MTHELIDSHAHVDSARLAADEAGVLARAREAGVTCVVNAGADMPSSRAAIALAHRSPMVFASVGVHPHDADEVTEADWAELEQLAEDERVVAIGECGLDFYRDLSPRDVQREVFARHLALAERVGLPVIIHCRDAYDEFLEVLRAERQAPVCGVLHCFQGDAVAARGALDMGLVLGIGGSLTFPREEALRQVVAGLPLDRLLIETDAPYLTPRPMRGKNEPAYVRFVAERLAEVLGERIERVAAVTTANARDLFGLPQ
ncbi:TatD family hydrolase [bacterium]|nr:TatD family hydrolase [bacterium]